MCKQPLRILHQKSLGHKSGEFIGFISFRVVEILGVYILLFQRVVFRDSL